MSLVWLPPVISSLLPPCIHHVSKFPLPLQQQNRGLTQTCCFGPGCGLNNHSRSFLTKGDFIAAVVEGTRVPRSHPSVTPPALVGTCAVHQQLKYINIMQSQRKTKSCPKGEEHPALMALNLRFSFASFSVFTAHTQKFKFSLSLQKQQRAKTRRVWERKSGKSRLE